MKQNEKTSVHVGHCIALTILFDSLSSHLAFLKENRNCFSVGVKWMEEHKRNAARVGSTLGARLPSSAVTKVCMVF